MDIETIVRCSLAGCGKTQVIEDRLGGITIPDAGIQVTDHNRQPPPASETLSDHLIRATRRLRTPSSDYTYWFCSWSHAAEYATQRASEQ
jgi:hypothetical protein